MRKMSKGPLAGHYADGRGHDTDLSCCQPKATKLELTSFSSYDSATGEGGDERVRTVAIPAGFRGQQSIRINGWEITLFEDGELIIDRSSVEHSDVAIVPTLVNSNGNTWSVKLAPALPDVD